MVKIIYEKDKEIQQNENKTTITREIQFEADDIIEIATSNLLPQERSRHPKLSAYYLESSRTVQVGNLNRRVQARATLSYVNSSSSVNYVSGVDPWDLGAQNVNFDFIESPTQLTIGTKKDGTYIQNLNSARCRILAETTESIAVLSFSFSVKAKASGEPQNPAAVIERQIDIIHIGRLGTVNPGDFHLTDWMKPEFIRDFF